MRLTHLRIRYGQRRDLDAPALVFAWTAALPPRVAPLEWQPPCDVAETAEELTVTAELGGLRDDELEVLLYEDSLVIQGVRPWRAAGRPIRVHLAELSYGPFRVIVSLPSPVDAAAARASYERGILTVTLPKVGAVPP